MCETSNERIVYKENNIKRGQYHGASTNY